MVITTTSTMKLIKKILLIVGIVLLTVIIGGGSVIYIAAQRSIIPDNIDMSSMSSSTMDGMDMGTPSADATPITALVAGPSDAPIKTFTLTTQAAKIDLGNGKLVDAYTYNGTVPGPELRVQQGDRVVVKLINKLPVSTTIHWHGVSVPNAEDGVAGLTQDAVKPGASYTYSFIANDIGTYWYHSHQETLTQLPLGLFGAFIVEPKNPSVQYDRDYAIFLHEWITSKACRQTCPETLSINDKSDKVLFTAKPGEKVRLRVANSGNDIHRPVLVGTPFEVIALDGHDLNGPTPLNNVALPISAAQRYDLSFTMPTRGSVTLTDADDRADPKGQHPLAIVGDGSSVPTYPENPTQFDLSSYGTPTADTITVNSHFDVQHEMKLNNQLGFFNGEFTMTFPINDKTYPDIPSIKVKMGDLVKIHITNTGDIPHSIHLHGHVFTVLTHNGKPLSGSPVHLDSITINDGEAYEVAFLANNPGLWMLHCHMVEHDAHGMDMMVEYPDIFTSFTIGKASGNNPF